MGNKESKSANTKGAAETQDSPEEDKRLLEMNTNNSTDHKVSAADVLNEVNHAEMTKMADPDRETWGKKVDFLLSVIGFAVDLANVWRFPYLCYKNGGGMGKYIRLVLVAYFLLSVIGFAVDLANVWRFPYLCYKNGGGAFLIPYTLMLLLAGIPLFFMELALGQFNRKGAITCWGRICPLFKGIGYTVVMIAFYTDFYYNVIISWALYYFFASFTRELPWKTCGNSWNSKNCYAGDYVSPENPAAPSNASSYNVLSNSTATNATSIPLATTELRHSPAKEYFEQSVMNLDATDGINSLGSIRWQLALCLLAVYLICYFSLWKGISTSGKVVWFTALFPYVVLFILLIRGVTLEGSAQGITYYLKPQWHRLAKAEVWVDAATQVFFSLGPGFGVLLAFASYNKFHNNVYADALVTSTINCLTSFLSGFVIFSVLGHMSYKSGTPIDQVATHGPGLVFEVYPEAIATLPGSTFFALIFFMMLMTLGLDSSFGGSEAIITALSDEFTWVRKHREIFVGLLFGFYMIVGLPSCTQLLDKKSTYNGPWGNSPGTGPDGKIRFIGAQGGAYMVTLMDRYAAGYSILVAVFFETVSFRGGAYMVTLMDRYAASYSILVAVFFETVAVSWMYGVDRFAEDLKSMLGFNIGIYWKLCWKFIGPIFILGVLTAGFIQYEPATYGDYVYPLWANMVGWTIACSSVLCIPGYALYQIIRTPGSLKMRLQRLMTPWRDSHRQSIMDSVKVNGGEPTQEV